MTREEAIERFPVGSMVTWDRKTRKAKVIGHGTDELAVEYLTFVLGVPYSVNIVACYLIHSDFNKPSWDFDAPEMWAESDHSDVFRFIKIHPELWVKTDKTDEAGWIYLRREIEKEYSPCAAPDDADEYR